MSDRKRVFGTIWAAGDCCRHQVDRPRQDAHERRRFWAGIASGMASEDAGGCGRRAAGYRNKMVLERRAACHQRYLVDRRSRTLGDICPRQNARSLDSTCAGCWRTERSLGRWGARHRRSRGSRVTAMPRRAAEAWTTVQPQRSGMPIGQPDVRNQ